MGAFGEKRDKKRVELSFFHFFSLNL